MLLFYFIHLLFEAACAEGAPPLCTDCSSRDSKLCVTCSAIGSNELGPNVCAACGLGMCLQCTADQSSSNNDKCTKCTSGYTVVDNRCAACNDTINGTPNCIECSQRYSNYPQLLCTGCSDGHVLYSNFCPPCSDFTDAHCALCSPSTYGPNTTIKCTECEEGYKLSKYGDHYTCKKSFTVVEILGIVFGTFVGLIAVIASAILLDMHITKL